MIGDGQVNASVGAAIGALRGAFDAAARSVQQRRDAIAGLARVGAAAGIDSRDAAGPLLERISVADSVWLRLQRAAGELEAGRAVLWYYGDRWLVIPRSIIPAGAGDFLGGWQIFVGVGLAVAGIVAFMIASALVANFYLEVRAAEAQNERIRLDAVARAQQMVIDACASGDPETCRRAQQAYAGLAPSLAPPQQTGPGWPAAAAAGAGGLAIGVLLMLFLSSRSSRRRNPRRRRR